MFAEISAENKHEYDISWHFLEIFIATARVDSTRSCTMLSHLRARIAAHAETSGEDERPDDGAKARLSQFIQLAGSNSIYSLGSL